MSVDTPTNENANARKPLVLAKAVKNTLDGSTTVKAKRSQQRHVLPKSKKVTLCGIDTSKWAAKDEVIETTVNCSLCADALKAQAKPAKADS